MNAKMILTIAILGYATWWGWKKYVLLQNVQIELKSASIFGNLLQPKIKVSLLVKNPTQLAAKLTDLDGYIVDSKNNKIAELSISGVYTIDPNSYIIIPVEIKTSTFEILNTLADFYYNKAEYFNIYGYATVDNIPVPYQFNVKI